MSTTLTRWRDTAFGPLDWGGLLPLFAPEIRVEQYVEEGHFVVRAELPGFDPEKDVTLTAADGVLKIRAAREQQKRENGHSEFHYGQFDRLIGLPAGAKEQTAVAKYGAGVLEVSFELGEPEEAATHIAIEIQKEAPTRGGKNK